MKPRASRQQGFSLVELLVTALIFAIGLLGLAVLQVSTLRANSGGRNRFTATSLAEGCMSAIQAEGANSWAYASGIVGNGKAYPGPKVYTGGNLNGPFGTFDINGQPVVAASPTQVFTVSWVQKAVGTQVPNGGIAGMNLREFVVTVAWTDQAPATLSMSRLIRY